MERQILDRIYSDEEAVSLFYIKVLYFYTTSKGNIDQSESKTSLDV